MVEPLTFNDELRCVELIDQTLLPREVVTIRCHNAADVAHAIRTMQIRGAPAIGVAAAYGVFLGLRGCCDGHEDLSGRLTEVVELLAGTRPTAVNLFWALKRVRTAVLQAVAGKPAVGLGEAAQQAALTTAQAIQAEDLAMCRAIGFHGAEFLHDGDTWLTHCNAGALATAGFGTALGVFRAAREQGKTFRVFVDETRPLLQGSRLTAWELVHEGIDAVLICDNMAGSLMAAGKVKGVVVGADRITASGYVANKIGTYPLAVLAHYHKVPFYVAAPVSTFDLTLDAGSDIEIEERDPNEVRALGGRPTAPTGMPVFNPAFDVTPPELVTAIFTNVGVLRAPFRESIAAGIAPHLEAQR